MPGKPTINFQETFRTSAFDTGIQLASTMLARRRENINEQ